MSNIGNKQTMAKNLAYYVEKSERTQKELAEVVGVAASTFNDWMKAKKYPRIDKIEILAEYFGILKSDLIEDASAKNEMNEDTDSFTSIFQRLSPSHQKAILEYINFLSAQERHDDDQK